MKIIIALIFIVVLHGSEGRATTSKPKLLPKILNPNLKIINGSTVPEGLTPYQVYLRWMEIPGKIESVVCGGCILNKRWILTAAHCVTGFPDFPSKLLVGVGSNSLEKGGQTYTVEKVVAHPKWDENDMLNDIALLRLSKDIVFEKLVKSINIPDKPTKPGTNLMVTGWGITNLNGTRPVDLQMINVTAITFEDCKKRLQSWSVHKSNICTMQQETGQGTCFGDSGGPLVDGNTVVGIVSWGVPCAGGYPDVYTQVYSYRKWILKQIKN